jgi:ATP-dependent DNA helicase RecG
MKFVESEQLELKSSFQKEVIAPTFKEFQHGFRVTIYKERLKVGGVSEGVNDLLGFIKANPNLRTPQLEKHLNVPVKTLERWLKHLKDAGKIEFRGSSKTGGYYVKED